MHALFFEPPLETNFLGHIVAEVYKDGIYESLLRGRNGLTILDIGANIGVTSYYFSQFAKQVYSLEPSLEHFTIFTQMLQFNKIDNVKPIKKALWIENKKMPFGGPINNKTMRSLHMATWEGGQPQEKVDAVTLDTLFEDEKIEHVDLMKLDVEGSEAEILAGEGFKKVSPKIDTILLETHSWSGRHPNQIVEALKNNGFIVEQVPNDASILIARK